MFTHVLPGGKKIRVKSCTQIVDCIWGHIRSRLKNSARRVGNIAFVRKIRAAQWTYWHKGVNLWMATGRMLQDLL